MTPHPVSEAAQKPEEGHSSRSEVSDRSSDTQAAPSFTPGPWRVETTNHPQELNISSSAADPHLKYTEWVGLAVVYGCDDIPEMGAKVMRANAHLIAASPSMYTALQLASNVLFLLQDEVKALGFRAGNVPEIVRSALSLAKGEDK